MDHAVDAQFSARAIHGLLALPDLHHRRGGRFVGPLGAQMLLYGDHGGVHQDSARLATVKALANELASDLGPGEVPAVRGPIAQRLEQGTHHSKRGFWTHWEPCGIRCPKH